jgi:hypothetical protein
MHPPKNCAEQVEQFAKYVWESGWKGNFLIFISQVIKF